MTWLPPPPQADADGGLLLMAVYTFVQRRVVTDPTCVDATKRRQAKQKTKLSIQESASFLARARAALGVRTHSIFFLRLSSRLPPSFWPFSVPFIFYIVLILWTFRVRGHEQLSDYRKTPKPSNLFVLLFVVWWQAGFELGQEERNTNTSFLC